MGFAIPELGFSDYGGYREPPLEPRIPGALAQDAVDVTLDVELGENAEKRGRLARELHDWVSNPLSEMLLEMEYLKRRGGESVPCDEIEVLQSSTREVLQNLRRLLSDLRDEPCHVTGFADLVRQTLERFERQSGIHTVFGADDAWPRRMVGRTAHHLLRIVEEALQNVRRHSCASSVEVTLERRGDAAVITIQDDGKGLQGVPDGQGHGIRGMQEYATLAGCELRVEGLPDQGTAVTVLLLLEEG